MDLAPGDTVIVGGRLGTITRTGKRGNAPGYWVDAPTGDPGSRGALASFAPDWTVRRAVVGDTVCPKPRGECTCGLVHVTHPDSLS